MKKVIALIAAVAWTITPANADVYVKVDANGNAIGGAIVCDYETCGDLNSAYARATLNEGERYALQGYGSTGIGIDSGIALKVDVETNVWTATTPNSVSTFNTGSSPTFITPVTPVIVETSTVISDTATALIDTATATIKNVTVSDAYTEIMALLAKIFQLLAILNR
jgi:hypothetical protein